MKIASFEVDGHASYGAVVADGVIDLGRQFGAAHPTLRHALAAGALPPGEPSGKPDYRLDEVTLLQPVPNPGKILCIGVNYRAHAAEAGLPLPPFPSVFLRAPDSIVASGGTVLRPKLSDNFDFEGELAVIIGTRGRHIPRNQALQHVFGYSCFNDGSVRDYQFKHTLTVGKNFWRSGGFGPWIVTADEIPDPAALHLTTRLNGEVMQDSPVDDLIFDVPAIIEYVSGFTELLPGDVIATGTPHGVGLARKPPHWLKAGDRLEVEISKIGILRLAIEDEK